MTTTPSARTRPSRIAAFARLLAGFALAYLAVNVANALVIERLPELRVDPWLGLVPVSTSSSITTLDGRSVQHGFNRFGSVLLPVRPHARKRVLLLGDSESASYALDPRWHYARRLGERFPDIEFTVIAQPNYSVSDYLRAARGFDAFADYDLVVLQGCALDVSVEAFGQGRGRGLARATVVGDSIETGSEPLGWVGSHLGPYNRMLRYDAVGRGLIHVARGFENVFRPHRKAHAAPPDSLDLTHMDLLLSSLQRAIRPPVVWLDLPRIHGEAEARDYDRVATARLAAACERAGIEHVDAGPVLRSWRSAHGDFANGFPWTRPGVGHLNADGHRLLADAIAPALARIEGR